MDRFKLDLKGRLDRCVDCILFVEMREGRGLCTAHGRAQKSGDPACRTHFRSLSKEADPQPA